MILREVQADAGSEKAMNQIRIERAVLGQVSTNCYQVMNEQTGEMIVVDPADRADLIAARIREMKGTPAAILLTHGHFDHIGAVDELREMFGIECYAMAAEEELLSSVQINLSAMFGHPLTVKADRLLTDGQEITLAGIRIRAIWTPGHTEGGGCYYLPDEKLLFSGDTLFAESVGRSDFPTGSSSKLVRSVREKLMVLPEDTVVYPGHGEQTSIEHEKMYNPFI